MNRPKAQRKGRKKINESHYNHACSLVGTIALLLIAGAARWSFIYLIRYRLLKREVKNSHYEISGKRDIMAVIIAVITLIAVAIMLIYGVPFVVEHFSELPILQ